MAQPVALGAENCWVEPSTMVAVAGETTSGATKVTVVVPVPPGPVAVTVSVPVAVVTAGAVYSPAAVMDPATAFQDVTLLAENCCVVPSPTVGADGDTTGAGVETAFLTGAVSALLGQNPGLATVHVIVAGLAGT